MNCLTRVHRLHGQAQDSQLLLKDEQERTQAEAKKAEDNAKVSQEEALSEVSTTAEVECVL